MCSKPSSLSSSRASRTTPESAAELLAVGDSMRDERLDPAEHAAWTTLCSLILNLDESMTPWLRRTIASSLWV